MLLKKKRIDLPLADKYEAVKLIQEKIPHTEIAMQHHSLQPALFQIIVMPIEQSMSIFVLYNLQYR